MPPQLRLSPTQLDDLAEIRETSPALLKTIADRFQRADPDLMRPEDLRREVAQILGGRSEAADRIMRALLSFWDAIRQRVVAVNEVAGAVRQVLEAPSSKWDPTDIARWHTVEHLFTQLLDSPLLRLVATVLDLMYERDNLLKSVRVFTDIRPVFSEDASQINGAVVSHTMRLRYDSTDGGQSISVALDERDILELERQCKRALQKAQTARTLMVQHAKIPTVISGDGSNDPA